MIRILTFVYILFYYCTTSAATSEYYFTNHQQKVSFPFKVFNNLLLIDVKINQKKTLQFIFDSGCKSTLIIHPKWIDSFDIPLRHKVYFSGLGNKDSVETFKITNGTIEIDALKSDRVPIYILSKDTLIIDKYLGTHVDGILGAEIFEKYYVHINYKKRKIELYQHKPKNIKSKYKKVNITLHNSKGYLTCTILNENNEFFLSELLLDTGANIPVIIKNKTPQQINIQKYIDAEIGEGLSGPLYAQVSRIKKIFFDTIQFNQVITAFNESLITFKDIDEVTLDGNIGNDILSRLDVYFAFPENALYYKNTKSTYLPFEFTVNNIILLDNKTKEGGFVVKSIAGNSAPLQAGLQKGDIIMKIGKQKCNNMKLEDALMLLNKQIGKKINLIFNRSDASYKISYTISSVI